MKASPSPAGPKPCGAKPKVAAGARTKMRASPAVREEPEDLTMFHGLWHYGEVGVARGP